MGLIKGDVAMLEDSLFLLFLIMGIGFVLGRITIKGVSFGSAGILLVALVFGHFGYQVPSAIQNIGLACFVTGVGFIAGPTFLQNFKGNVRSYLVIGACIILSGVLTCVAVIFLTGTSVPLSLGLLAGAMTTTPGLAAGMEVTGSDLVSVGYGLAYPFGVLAVVFFVQLVPKVLKIDLEAEKRLLQEKTKAEPKTFPEKMILMDAYGLFSFALAVILGILLGKIKVPLPGGGAFSLGNSGGPLLIGIVLGQMQNLGPIDLRINKNALVTMRELGLCFFLAGAGTKAGEGFVKVLLAEGPVVFLYGAVMAIVPLFAGYLTAKKLCKLNTLDSMGSICGGMTSTPALGTLITSTGCDAVTSSYAATYPVALALIVVMIELVGGMMA